MEGIGMTTPNKERIELFCKALESGEYTQTHNYLHDKNGFCCLGVATDIFHKQTGFGEWKFIESTGFYEFKFEEEGMVITESTGMSKVIGNWYGFDNNVDEYFTDLLMRDENGELVYATYLNDCDKLDFNQISTIIRQNFIKEQENVS